MTNQKHPSRPPVRVVGITIVELVVSLAVVSILVTTGVPAFSNFIQSNKISESAFDALGTINLARAEAVKRRTRVVLCRSADPTAATPACGGSANTWTTGWLVFAAGDSNNTYQAATDTLLGRGIVHSSNVTVITNSTSKYGRQIDIPPHGRPKFVRGDTSAPINCTSPT
jgi:type IV fimbrial biogenesis protein FimT